MANIGTLTAQLGLNTRDLQTGAARARATFTGLEGSAKSSFAGIGASAAKLGAFLGVALGGAAMLNVFKKMISIGVDFQYTMATVGGVMRATAEEMESLTATAKRMGETTEFTASQAGEALRFLGMAGFDAAEAAEALPGVLDLATAGTIDLGRAADIASNALTAMNLPVKQLTRVNDVFIGTITRSNVNMEQMAESFKYAAPVAKAYGYEIEELSGLIGALGDAGIQGCYDDQTEVLTRRGWLPWPDVTDQDEFATRNPKTAEIEYQKPIRLIRYHHNGPMYYVQNRAIDLCVTPDHRMWIKKRDHDNFEVLCAEEVDTKSVSYEAGGLSWKGHDLEHFELSAFNQNRASWIKQVPAATINAELWATVLGWYISEGSSSYMRGNYRIRITQSVGAVRDKMRVTFKKLPFVVHEDKNGFSVTNEQFYRALAYLGKAPEKHIPDYAKDWSPRLLRILLDSLIEGDGDSNGAYYTSSQQLADDVSEIVLKLGHAATVVLCAPAGRFSNFDKENRAIVSRYDQWKVNIRTKQLHPQFYPYEYRGKHGDRLDGSVAFCRSGWVHYDGEVFCAEVPNHLLIVRRNGKVVVSGNSMAGTQLAMAFQQAGKIAGELGLESSDLVDVLQALRDRGEETTTIMDRFGIRAGRAVGVLVDRLSEVRAFQQTLTDVSGEAGKLAETMRTTVKGSFAELKSVIQSVAIDAFDRFGDSVNRNLQDLIVWVRENKANIVGFINTIAQSVDAVAKTIGRIVSIIGSFTGAVDAHFRMIDERMASTASNAAKSAEKIRAALEPPSLTDWQAFIGWIEIAINNLGVLLEAIGATIGTVITQITQFVFVDLLKNVAAAIEQIGRMILAIPSAITSLSFQPIKKEFDELVTVGTKMSTDITGNWEKMFVRLKAIAKEFDVSFDFTGPQARANQRFEDEMRASATRAVGVFYAGMAKLSSGVDIGKPKGVLAPEIDTESQQAALNSIVQIYADMAAVAGQTEQQMRSIWEGYRNARVAQIDAEANALIKKLPEQAQAIQEWIEQMKAQLPEEFAGLLPQPADTSAIVDAQLRAYEQILQSGLGTRAELQRVWQEYHALRLEQIRLEAETMLAQGAAITQLIPIVQTAMAELEGMKDVWDPVKQDGAETMAFLGQLSGNAVAAIVNDFKGMDGEASAIFSRMAIHFIKFFAEKALSATTFGFVSPFLDILGSLFDKARNDAMAAREGGRFMEHFGSGALQKLSGLDLGRQIANLPNTIPVMRAVASGGDGASLDSPLSSKAASPININVNSPVTRADFVDLVETDVVDIIQRSSDWRRNRLALKSRFQTTESLEVIK